MQSKGWFSILAAAFLAAATTASAQRGSNWRVYKAADGLPETLTTSVSIGTHGNIWVRSPSVEWIGRLDGYEVKSIPAPGLGNSHIYESPSGQIWTYTTGGLQLYREAGHTWIQFEVPEVTAALRKASLGIVRSVELYPIKQNQILILEPEGLLQFNADERQQTKTILLRAAEKTGLQKFSSLCAARDGGLWIVGDAGLAKLPGPIRNLTPEIPWQEFLAPTELGLHNFHHPVEDDAGGVTMLADNLQGGKTVMAHFDGQQWTIQTETSEKVIQGWRGEDSSFWLATFHSLEQFRSGQSMLESSEEMPRRNFDAAVETNGIFWLATSDGLMRYAPLAWQSPRVPGLSNSPIQSITEDQAGRLWILSANSIHLFQNDVWTNYPLPAGYAPSAAGTHGLFVSPGGNLVLQGGSGVLQLDLQSGTFSSLNDGGKMRLKVLGPLKNGTLCVQPLNDSGQLGQLEVFDGTNFAPFPYSLPEAISTGEIRFVFAAPDGNVWLSGEHGLAWYHDKKWQGFPSTASAPSEPPSSMVEISDGKFWCGVQDVIMEFNGSAWVSIRAGFYHVNSLVKSRDGSVWVASDNGLHRFYHGAWSVNGQEEGLPGAAVLDVHEDSRGHIWAATARGLSLYHPEADPDPPQTYIQNLPGPNNSVREGSVVSISFSAQDKWKYTAPDRLLFSYRLDGQDWSPYQEQRSATFLELPAGKHSFHVRSMDRNWNVDPKPAVLEFAVTVPWYREAPLMLISATGLGLVVFFAGLAFNRHRQLLHSYAEVEAKVALRTQQLDLANRELFHSQKMNALGTLAAGIAHDFNNILSIIKGSAQIIEDNLDNADKIRTRTDRIKTVVEQGAGIVKAMLGFSRASDRQFTLCNINSVVQETITLLGDRFLRETEVQFTPSAVALPEVPASKDFIQQILLNLIFNAAEAMTNRRQIILSVVQSRQLPSALALKPLTAESYVLISVKDFGSGIAPDVLPRIFEPFFTTKALSVRRGTGLGLSMAYELAQQMDCGLHVESTPGQGSVFTLIIPVRNLPVATPV